MRAFPCVTPVSQRGFTLLELMVAVAIIGVLAVTAGVQYSQYVRKAQMTEAVLQLDAMRTGFYVAYETQNEIPDSIATAPNTVSKLPSSKVVDEYWYGTDKGANQAWVAIKVDSSVISECTGNCTLHWGFDTSCPGVVNEVCGTWTTANDFPTHLLPDNCQSSCVSCDLASAASCTSSDNSSDTSTSSGGSSSDSGSDTSSTASGSDTSASSGSSTDSSSDGSTSSDSGSQDSSEDSNTKNCSGVGNPDCTPKDKDDKSNNKGGKK